MNLNALTLTFDLNVHLDDKASMYTTRVQQLLTDFGWARCICDGRWLPGFVSTSPVASAVRPLADRCHSRHADVDRATVTTVDPPSSRPFSSFLKEVWFSGNICKYCEGSFLLGLGLWLWLGFQYWNDQKLPKTFVLVFPIQHHPSDLSCCTLCFYLHSVCVIVFSEVCDDVLVWRQHRQQWFWGGSGPCKWWL